MKVNESFEDLPEAESIRRRLDPAVRIVITCPRCGYKLDVVYSTCRGEREFYCRKCKLRGILSMGEQTLSHARWLREREKGREGDGLSEAV